MARPLRLEYPGAVHHVTARGHERGSMFREDMDRERFLALLGSITCNLGWELHAYCLMGNHYHLLVETPSGGLSRGMRALNGRYAQWFNRSHRRRGHFLEGRFRSVLVQKESHLLELHRYVVLNPVRAGLVQRTADWKWSSYRATAGLAKAPEWLEVDWTLGQFARSLSMARQAFRRFVAEGKGSGSDMEALERGGLLGDEVFTNKIRQLLEGKKLSDEIPLRYRPVAQVALEDIRREVARAWRVLEEVLERRRGGNEKKAAIFLARKLTHLGGREIGAAFGVKAARVSNIVTDIEGKGSPLERRIEQVRQKLVGRPD